MGDAEAEPEQEEPVVSTSEMCQDGSSTTVVWHLKGWQEHYAFLKDNAACIVEFVEGEESEGPSPVKLRFYLGEFIRQVGSNKWKRWYSLWMSVVNREGEENEESNADDKKEEKRSFLVEVTEEEEEEGEEGGEGCGEEGEGEEDDEDDDEDIEVKAHITVSMEKDGGVLVKEEFIPMFWWKTEDGGSSSGEHLTEWAESDELKFKITVSQFHYTGSDVDNKEGDPEEEQDKEEVEEAEEPEPAPLVRDLKAMYAAEENYADLSLEARDGMILHAHKFVLAARSPYFRGIIEKEMKKKAGFSNLIKLSNVDGKPLMVVLHWMYTDELDHELLAKVMDEVIKVSVKWELTDLLKLLDKKLISVCNIKNMLHLFQVAHKNGLCIATQDISDYIKENIDSVVPLAIGTRKAEPS